MFLKEVKSNALIEIADVEKLTSPFQRTVSGKSQAGEEEQEAIEYAKVDLLFPSGERLPRCWLDSKFQTS